MTQMETHKDLINTQCETHQEKQTTTGLKDFKKTSLGQRLETYVLFDFAFASSRIVSVNILVVNIQYT